MRIIQYPVTLLGGYSLFNHSDASDLESEGDPRCPGIRMSAVRDSDLAAIADVFDFASAGDSDNPDLREHFQE